MDDCLVIGGGVVGLSIAYELAGHGLKVRVIDRGIPGKEASWAGAGMLPAAVLRSGDSAYDQLSGLSHQLHPEWAEQLRAETGIDTAYRQCGEIFLARDRKLRETSLEDVRDLQARGIRVEQLDAESLRELEPVLNATDLTSPDLFAYCTPDAAQIRNPWHLQALEKACEMRGVAIVQHADAVGFAVDGDRINTVKTTGGDFSAGHFCLTTGAWTGLLADSLGLKLPIKPIRGQIALIRIPEQIVRGVIHEGPHYVVPRADGHALVGSTLEDVGFEKQTTASAIAEMLRFAGSLSPQLAAADVKQCWAGFRPGSADDRPFMGPLPELSNGWIAAGHYRWGLFLSPATAVVMGERIRGLAPRVELQDFCVGR